MFTISTSYIQSVLDGHADTGRLQRWLIALLQRAKQRINVPTSGANSRPPSPLLSSNLCGLKTSIGRQNINALRNGNAFEPTQSGRMKEVPFKGLFLRPMTQRWRLKVACLLCSGHTPNCHFLFATPAARSARAELPTSAEEHFETATNRLHETGTKKENRLKRPLIVLAGHMTSQMFPLACTEPTIGGTICGLSVHFLCGPSPFLFF